MNKSASSELGLQMGPLSAEVRKKRLGKKGMSNSLAVNRKESSVHTLR
jgi:hypothetical protein